MSTMDDMREELMQTLRDLRNRDRPMEVDRARAVAQVASVLVDSARAEVDYIKATKDADLRSSFISPAIPGPEKSSSGGSIQRSPTGLTHRVGD